MRPRPANLASGWPLSKAAPPLLPSKPKVEEHTLTLPDTRKLAYATWGSPANPPLLFLHGFPGSRLEVSAIAPLIVSQGVRLIAPDRPGFGASSPFPGRSITSYPADVAALLDHLGIGRAAILGGSGGAPYALACGTLIRDRVAALGALASAPPWTAGVTMPLPDRALRWAILNAPRLTTALVDVFVNVARRCAEHPYAAKKIEEYLEKQGVEKPGEGREELVRVVFEGFAQGPQAAVEEALLLSQDWGFPLREVKAGPVRVWHGEGDARAPIEAIRWMAGGMGAELVVLKGGHFDVHAAMPEVVQTLMADAGWTPRDEQSGE